MTATNSPAQIQLPGNIRFQPDTKSVTGEDGKTVALEDKIAELLVLLCERSGEIVSREDILGQVWTGRQLSEQTVPVAISKLRKALREMGAPDDLLQTVPKRGYRLSVQMEEGGTEPDVTPAVRFGRWWAVAAILLVVVGAAIFWPGQVPLTPPAGAEKPGIILTVHDFRTESEDPTDRRKVIALSELTSHFLSQVPDVLVIRHWWNVDAPDPTGGIYTRYGKDTPVYLLSGSLIEQDGDPVVTLFLNIPSTDEVIWSGMYRVADGSVALFEQLAFMFGHLGISRLPQVVRPASEDDRYWTGRYLASLSSEGSAAGAVELLEQVLAESPDDEAARRVLNALAARWPTLADKAKAPVSGASGSERVDDYARDLDLAALALYRDENADRALAMVSAVLERAPGDHVALALKGEILAKQGDALGALDAYRKAVRLAPFATAYTERIAALEGS